MCVVSENELPYVLHSFHQQVFWGPHRYAKSHHTRSCVWFPLLVWVHSWSLQSWIRLQLFCDIVNNTASFLKMKRSWTAARRCCISMPWWIPVCFRYIVNWRRGCWITIHNAEKTFRKANFVINQHPKIDQYFIPLPGHSHKMIILNYLR
jgi:hypothetical protein